MKKETVKMSIAVPIEIHKLLVEEAEFEDRSVNKTVVRILKQHYGQKSYEDD